MIAFRGGSENKALSRISEALGPGVTGYHCTWGFYRKLRSWDVGKLCGHASMSAGRAAPRGRYASWGKAGELRNSPADLGILEHEGKSGEGAETKTP